MEEFSPRLAFAEALDRWWLIVLLTVAGGLIGYAVHFLQPPVYQAQATFNVSLNFTQTGSLSQFEEDHAWNTAGGLIGSTPVLEAAARQANEQGVSLDPAGLNAMISLERKEYVWILRVRNRDPQTAARLANLWADEANRQLQEARGHALQAELLQRHITALESCLAAGPAAGSGQSGCGSASLGEVQGELASAGQALTQETALARGIIPSLAFDLNQRAVVPTEPAEFGSNVQVLAGLLIGFTLAIWAANAFPARSSWRPRLG